MYQLYHSEGLFVYCPHSIAQLYVLSYLQLFIMPLHDIHRFVFLTETDCVLCEYGTENL